MSVVTFLHPLRSSAQTTVTGSAEYERFGSNLQSWKRAVFELSKKSGRGTIIGRVEQAWRFGETGTLFEAEAWPRFSKSTYAYIDVGGSSSSILPHRRYAAELFHALPNAWELSGGARRIDFGGQSTIYTGSVGKYRGNYWVAARPWIIDREGETLRALSLTARRYFATSDDYIGLEAHAGETPADPTVARELGMTEWSGGVSVQRLVGSILLRGRIAVESIDTGSAGSRRGTITTLGIGRRF